MTDIEGSWNWVSADQAQPDDIGYQAPPEQLRTCVYCQATGAAEHFEPIGNQSGNQACRQTELCQLRRNGYDPVHLTLTLVRQLAQVAWQDIEARKAAGQAGSPESASYQPMLGTDDLARLHLVLGAAAGRISPDGSADSAAALAQARADYGCRTCGAIGRDDCTTVTGVSEVPRTHGTWGPRWHKGRTL